MEFRTVQAERTQTVEQECTGDLPVITADDEHLFRPLRSSPADLLANVPVSHRKSLTKWIIGRTGERSNDEVVRRLWIDVLPAFAVQYTEGKTSKTAYLIGDGHTVRAPGAASPSAASLLTAAHHLRRGMKSRNAGAKTNR